MYLSSVYRNVVLIDAVLVNHISTRKYINIFPVRFNSFHTLYKQNSYDVWNDWTKCRVYIFQTLVSSETKKHMAEEIRLRTERNSVIARDWYALLCISFNNSEFINFLTTRVRKIQSDDILVETQSEITLNSIKSGCNFPKKNWSVLWVYFWRGFEWVLFNNFREFTWLSL